MFLLFYFPLLFPHFNNSLVYKKLKNILIKLRGVIAYMQNEFLLRTNIKV